MSKKSGLKVVKEKHFDEIESPLIKEANELLNGLVFRCKKTNKEIFISRELKGKRA